MTDILSPDEQRLLATLKSEPRVTEMVERLVAEIRSLRIDSMNYRGQCAVCGVACSEMLTDTFCVACERDRLQDSGAF